MSGWHASGRRHWSKGPTQAEFQAATEVLILHGKSMAARNRSGAPQRIQQAQQAAQQGSNRQATHQQGVVAAAKTQCLPQDQQQQQQQQGVLNSSRGQKRSAGAEPVIQAAAKRGKHADEVWPPL